MNIESLLQGTIDVRKDVREESERLLSSMHGEPQFLISLLQLNSKHSLVYLKNILRTNKALGTNAFKEQMFNALLNSSDEHLVDCYLQVAFKEDIQKCMEHRLLKVIENYANIHQFGMQINIVQDNLELILLETSKPAEIKSILKILYYCSRQNIDFSQHIPYVVKLLGVNMNCTKWVVKVLNQFTRVNSSSVFQLFQFYLTLEMDSKLRELMLNFLVMHYPKLKAKIAENFLVIFSNWILPLLDYNEKTAEIFIDKRDFIILYLDKNYSVAKEALQIISKKEDIFNAILKYLEQIPQHSSQQFGYLGVSAAISERLLKSSLQLENFIVQKIFPLIDSKEDYVKCYSFWCLSHYSKLNYLEQGNLEYLFQKVLQGLMHPLITVKITAALCIPQFLKYPDACEALKPHIVGIVKLLMEITNETDMGIVSHVLELLVFEYGKELEPYAIEVITQLMESLSHILSQQELDEDLESSEDKSMAAIGILKTVSSLILTLEKSPVILQQMEGQIYPALFYIFSHQCFDLIEEAFEITSIYIACMQTVTPLMWKLFDLIYQILRGEPDYFEEALPLLLNYVKFGKLAIGEQPTLQLQFYEIVQLIFNRDSSMETDIIRACILIEHILFLCPGTIDALFGRFMELAYNITFKRGIRSIPLRIHIIEVVLQSINYNAVAALQIMDSISWTKAFFDLFLNNYIHFKRVHDKKLVILSISSIFRTLNNSFLESLAPIKAILFQLVVKMFEQLPHAENVRKGLEDEDDLDLYDEHGILIDDIDSHEGNNSNTILPDDYEATEEVGWDIDTFLEEDPSFSSVLGHIDVYAVFINATMPLILNGILSVNQLDENGRNTLEEIFKRSSSSLETF